MIKSQKIQLTILIIILIILLVFFSNLLQKNHKKNIHQNEELSNTKIKSENTIFTIDKIIFFSNCSAKSKIQDNLNILIENLYQYTDIALYINNNPSNNQILSKENTLKKVYIDNINFLESPSIGKQTLFYKNTNEFSKDIILNENIIKDSIEFEITSENTADFSKPILYNNCANPITISYLNDNIKTNFGINNSNIITYNGSLLNECYVTLASLECTITFDVHIINNLDEEYISNIKFTIPLYTENKKLNDGTITVEQNTNFKFYKSK